MILAEKGAIQRALGEGWISLHSAEDPVHIHDLQATMLHALGLEHTRLTYNFMGRAFRLTDVGRNVVEKLVS